MCVTSRQHTSVPGRWTNWLVSRSCHKTTSRLCGTSVQQHATTNCIVPGSANVPVRVSRHFAEQCSPQQGGQKTWHARFASNWRHEVCSTNRSAWMLLNYQYFLRYK